MFRHREGPTLSAPRKLRRLAPIRFAVKNLRMSESAAILSFLRKYGRPPYWRTAIGRYFVLFDVAFFLMPIGALFWRIASRGTIDPSSALSRVLAGTLLSPLFLAALWAIRRSNDPIRVARALDDTYGREGRILTAADCAVRGDRSPFAQRLCEIVATELPTMRAISSSVVDLRPPALKRALLATILTILVFFVPGFGKGLFGAATSGGKSGPGGDEHESPERDALRRGEDAFGSRTLDLSASTDRAVYLLNEELNYTLRMFTHDAGEGPVDVRVILRVDGTDTVDLPLDWTIPAEAEQSIEATIPLRSILEQLKRWKPGLLTLETAVLPRERRADDERILESNRVTVELAENAKKDRAPAPQPAKKKPEPKPSPNPQANEKKSDPKSQPDAGREKPDPKDEPDPPPPEEIDAKPFVVEPLFSSDEKKERETRIYDRDPTDATKRNPSPPDPSRREYSPEAEAAIKKARLSAREEILVRRYFEALMPQAKPK